VPQALDLDPKCGNFFDMACHEGVYEAHAAYIKRVVPEKQLLYFDVRQGWEPLCRWLDVDLPNQDFPHEFPRIWLTKGNAASLKKLRLRLGALVTTGILVLGGLVYVGLKSAS
jgi:hypothetical protein